MQTNSVRSSEAQRFGENDSDFESQVIDCDLSRVELFCEKRDSTRVKTPYFSTGLESSQSNQISWFESL